MGCGYYLIMAHRPTSTSNPLTFSAFTASLDFIVDAAPESFPFCNLMLTELDMLDDLAAPNFLFELHSPQH